jgi:hypothetical protein
MTQRMTVVYSDAGGGCERRRYHFNIPNIIISIYTIGDARLDGGDIQTLDRIYPYPACVDAR